MITDKLKNINYYNFLPIEARNFIAELNPDLPIGRYNLSDKVYANVEEYTTKTIKSSKFEAHQDYIDVQILLNGQEYIYYTCKEELSVDVPYNSEKDITFYSESINDYNNILLDCLNFVILYPHEAHAPQVAVDNRQLPVKKVVIKVKI